MATLDELLAVLGPRFGVLAESSTTQLSVIARNSDVAIGDLFILPCRRGPDRMYVFRATQYANILNRTIVMGDVARNKLTMPDSYFAKDLAEEQLVELRGMVLGYAQFESGSGLWSFNRPRRLPQHLTDVFQVDPMRPESGTAVGELLRSQLGDSGLAIGHLLAGERALLTVPVYLPIAALSHHLGVFGRTGCGKSNLMMVLLAGVLDHNRAVGRNAALRRRASVFAIDPHDEFRTWHANTGGADGVRGIIRGYSDAERNDLVAPFYYLTGRDAMDSPLEARVRLSRADITPDDLASLIDFSEQQIAFTRQLFAEHGERWIGRLFAGDLGGEGEGNTEYLPGTIAAVERRRPRVPGAWQHAKLVARFDAEPWAAVRVPAAGYSVRARAWSSSDCRHDPARRAGAVSPEHCRSHSARSSRSGARLASRGFSRALFARDRFRVRGGPGERAHRSAKCRWSLLLERLINAA